MHSCGIPSISYVFKVLTYLLYGSIYGFTLSEVCCVMLKCNMVIHQSLLIPRLSNCSRSPHECLTAYSLSENSTYLEVFKIYTCLLGMDILCSWALNPMYLEDRVPFPVWHIPIPYESISVGEQSKRMYRQKRTYRSVVVMNTWNKSVLSWTTWTSHKNALFLSAELSLSGCILIRACRSNCGDVNRRGTCAAWTPSKMCYTTVSIRSHMLYTLISASRKNRMFSGFAADRPRGSKFLLLGSGPSAPLSPPANSIDGVARTVALDGRELSCESDARAPEGATKASAGKANVSAEAANAVFMADEPYWKQRMSMFGWRMCTK